MSDLKSGLVFWSPLGPDLLLILSLHQVEFLAFAVTCLEFALWKHGREEKEQ